jgi:N-acetylmuramoyl-L-alanine amidase
VIRDRAVALVVAVLAGGLLAVPVLTSQAFGPGQHEAVPTASSEVAPPPSSAPAPAATPTSGPTARAGSARRSAPAPLAGIRIALDPGHQLGNHRFPAQTSRLVQAGRFTKPCNTTGTATNGGYTEATLNFRVAQLVRARLEALGARVFLTRTRNSEDLWGPCVDRRGEFGASVGAGLEVSLHADGAPASGRGFHVIAPTRRRPWTTDIATASLRLAEALRSGLDTRGLPRSTYLGGGKGLVVRSDLGTLNMSDVPVAMIEIGNMRNASDARRMTSSKGRARYASAVVLGIRRYLHR